MGDSHTRFLLAFLCDNALSQVHEKISNLSWTVAMHTTIYDRYTTACNKIATVNDRLRYTATICDRMHATICDFIDAPFFLDF